MKPISFTEHARQQMINRQATEQEVQQAILEAPWSPAEKGRLTCSMAFSFEAEHYGRYYRSKDVVPIFIEEEEEIVVITVYTFFSQKEALK